LAVASSRTRHGSGIRAFLEYYILVVLNDGPASVEVIRETIVQRSSDNDKYRPGGALRVTRSDLGKVLQRLVAKKQVRSGAQDEVFVLTGQGRAALKRFEKEKEKTEDSKDEATAKLVSIIAARAGPPQGKRVLDVGTGEGYLAFKVADKGFEVLGIDSGELDYSKGVIKKARAKAQGNSNVEFRVARVDRLSPGGPFDGVVTSQAVHCMKNQEACLCAAFRLLRKGGVFVGSDFLVGLTGFFAHGFHAFLALSKEEWTANLRACGYHRIRRYEVNDYCVVAASKPE
jgi:2-polyprenyl-3-methyl-5-hydroxy-6-metoxy-1,4-benzoquinol methylase